MTHPPDPIRVLVADDDDAHAALTQAVVGGEERIEVVGRARDGREAVALAGELSPDLVVMDVSMPELDGIGATARIRELHPHVRVLMLSSLPPESVADRAVAAGASGFVRKDMVTRALVDAILAAVSG